MQPVVEHSRGRVLKRKQLIEDLAKCNYRAPSETSGSSSRLKGIEVIELNRMTVIEEKLDALMNKMGNQDRRMHSAYEVGTIDVNEQKSGANEGLAQEGSYQVEEAQFLNANRSYNFKPNLNLPTHYTPALRNHENSHMEVEHSKLKDRCRIFNNSMLHMGSKDNNSKKVKEQKIKVKGDLIPLKIDVDVHGRK